MHTGSHGRMADAASQKLLWSKETSVILQIAIEHFCWYLSSTIVLFHKNHWMFKRYHYFIEWYYNCGLLYHVDSQILYILDLLRNDNNLWLFCFPGCSFCCSSRPCPMIKFRRIKRASCDIILYFVRMYDVFNFIIVTSMLG